MSLPAHDLTPSRTTAYESPQFEVLGRLTDLAEGQGQHGQLIVMQSSGPGIPGGGGIGSGGSTVF